MPCREQVEHCENDGQNRACRKNNQKDCQHAPQIVRCRSDPREQIRTGAQRLRNQAEDSAVRYTFRFFDRHAGLRIIGIIVNAGRSEIIRPLEQPAVIA